MTEREALEELVAVAGEVYARVERTGQITRNLVADRELIDDRLVDAIAAAVGVLESPLKSWPSVHACGSLEDPGIVVTFPDGAAAVYVCRAGREIERELWSRLNERDIEEPHNCSWCKTRHTGYSIKDCPPIETVSPECSRCGATENLVRDDKQSWKCPACDSSERRDCGREVCPYQPPSENSIQEKP